MGRNWSYIGPSGQTINLSDRSNGIWVGEGSTGLDAPPYEFQTQLTPGVDGSAALAVRAASRTINVPVHVMGNTHVEYRLKIAAIANALDPAGGPVFDVGQLIIDDNTMNAPRALRCYYTGGLEGVADDNNAETLYQLLVLSFQSTDAFWENLASTSQQWNASGATLTNFFPFLPLTLSGNSLASAGSVTHTNHITNPSFENATANASLAGPLRWTYTLAGAATISYVSTTDGSPIFGARAGKLTLANGADNAVSTAIPPYQTAMTTEQVAGDVWTFSGYLKVSDQGINGGYVQPKILNALYQNEGSSSTPHAVLGDLLPADNQWHFFAIVYRKATTGTPQPCIDMNRQTFAATVLYMDGLMLVNGSDTDLPYIDGDQTDGSVWANAPATDRLAWSSRAPLNEPTILMVNGDADSYPIWTFTGKTDSIKVYLGDNPDVGFEIDFTLPTNRAIVVDTRPGLQSVTLDNGQNLWGSLNPNYDDLFPLKPGRNFLKALLTNVDASAAISVSYKSRWRMAP